MLKVIWEIDVDAEDPREAAEQALAIQRNAQSTATVFDVTDERGQTVRVDLMEQEATDVRV
jgi:hypothetical protein